MWSKATRAALAAFVFLCTVQALYWPIIMKPGTPIGWWQLEPLATLGLYLGAPVLLAIGKLRLPDAAQTILAWSLSFAWAALVFVALGAAGRALSKTRPAETR
jgi:hypothetical protein